MAARSTETYCTWLVTLPPAIALELAGALHRLFPGEALGAAPAAESSIEALAAHLRRLASSPAKDAGLALTLAALTDFVFLEHGTGEGWERTDAMLQLLDRTKENLGAPELEAQVAEFVEQSKLRQPLRERQWRKEGDIWAALRRELLEPQQILANVRAAMVEALEPPRG